MLRGRICLFVFFCLVPFVLQAGFASAATHSAILTRHITTSGQTLYFKFLGLPAALGNITVTVGLYGDYDSSSEYATVSIGGSYEGTISGGSPQCNTTAHEKSFTVPASTIVSDSLDVEVANSSGVDPICSDSRVEVEVSYSSAAPTEPDLYVSNFHVKTSGTDVTYSMTICNQGSSTSTAFPVDLFYHIPLGTSAPSCANLPSYSYRWTMTNGLAAGACSTTTQSRTAVSPGSYLAWVLADSDCLLSETTMENNVESESYAIAGGDGGVPDGSADLGVDAASELDGSVEAGWQWPDLGGTVSDGAGGDAREKADGGDRGCGCRLAARYAAPAGSSAAAAVALPALLLLGLALRRRR